VAGGTGGIGTGGAAVGGSGGAAAGGSAGAGGSVGSGGSGYVECIQIISSEWICSQLPGCVDGKVPCVAFSPEGHVTCSASAECVRCPDRSRYNCDGTSENGCELKADWNNCLGCGIACQSQYQQCKCTSAGCDCVYP
jgi:hypothetical protein